MGSNVEVKKALVEQLKLKLENSQTIVLAYYSGMTVSNMTQLRKQARDNHVYLKVFKNTLFKKAIRGTNFENLNDKIAGPLIYAISQDPISSAKLLNSFSKSDDNIKIKAGSCNGIVLDSNQVIELASIPSKEELLAKLLAVIQYPVSGFVRDLFALYNKKHQINDKQE